MKSPGITTITSPQSSLLLLRVGHWKPPADLHRPRETQRDPLQPRGRGVLPVPPSSSQFQGPRLQGLARSQSPPGPDPVPPPRESQHPRGAGDVLKARGSAPSPSFPNPARLSQLQGSCLQPHDPGMEFAPQLLIQMTANTTEIQKLPGCRYRDPSHARGAGLASQPRLPSAVSAPVCSLLSCEARGTFGQIFVGPSAGRGAQAWAGVCTAAMFCSRDLLTRLA